VVLSKIRSRKRITELKSRFSTHLKARKANISAKISKEIESS
jgi:hypothetical protein